MNIPRPLSQSTLKIIAVVSMLLDHIGFFLFPKISLFRMLGRLAFPIFAFFIMEGARYTSSRPKYLLRMIFFGVLCQTLAFILFPTQPLNIFITFSLSIIIIYLFDWLKGSKTEKDKLASMLVSVIVLILVFILTRLIEIEYGFGGVMLAPLASIPRTKADNPLDIPYRVLLTIPSFLVMSFDYIAIYQPLSFLVIPLLLFYSGKRGNYSLKYLFYLFYPTHIVILYLIRILII